MITPQSGRDEPPKQLHLRISDLEEQAKIHLDRGTFTASRWFDEHRERILTAPLQEDPKEQIEVLLRFVQWHFKDGHYEQGLVFALRAVHVARTLGFLALQRRSLNLLGLLYSRIGNQTEATVCYVEGLQIAEQIGDRVGKAAVLANLAELRFNNGLIGESIILNQYVVEIAANEPQFVQLIADAHHNIAAAALLLGDLNTATREIREAVRISLTPTNQFLVHQSVIVEATHSRILIENGCFAEAIECASRAELKALQMNSRPAMLQASLACALCDAVQGKVQLAFDRLNAARDQISSDEPLYRDLLEIEAICNGYAGKKVHAARLRQEHLSHLAKFQRRCVIRQVAAIQRSARALRSLPEEQLLALPADTRRRLAHTWANPEKSDALREHLEALASLADQREDAGGEHCLRVGRLAQLLALRLGYNELTAQMLGLAARLHDIGKLATPDVLLLKPSTLTSIELEIVRRHTIEGSQILTDILATMERGNGTNTVVGSMRLASEIALHHHEWWDGSGYPRRIGGHSIPESARITAVADVFDELTSRRPYRRRLTVAEATAHMKSLSGKQFDPSLFRTFVELLANLRECYGQELEKLAPRNTELSPYQKAIRVIERIVGSSPARLSEKAEGLYGKAARDPLAV